MAYDAYGNWTPDNPYDTTSGSLMPYAGPVMGPGFPGSGQPSTTTPTATNTSLQPSMPNTVPGSVGQFWASQFAQPTTTGTPQAAAATGSDLRSQLAAVYQQAGLDPNNPGANLADINYFLQRAQQTNPNDIGYWTNRLSQEIQGWKARGGAPGPPEAGSGGSAYGTGAFGSLMSGYPGFTAPGSAQFTFTPPGTSVSSLPSWAQPYTQQYSLPTAEEARNTPGYQFALQQGLQAVDQGAAAKGSLLSGGTLKAEQQYGQGLADTAYQQRVQNSLAEFGTNYGVYQGNQAAAAGAYQQMFNNALSTFGANTGAYQQAFNNALAAYGTNFGVSNTLANNQFNWNYATAGLGMNANNALTGAGNNYGNNLAALYAAIGNANAAGTVGSNNAINNGINNALASWYPFLYGL